MNIHEIIKYYNEGNSMNACSRKFKISGYKIKKLLLDNNVTTRTQSEQAKIENIKRTKSVNDNYFTTLNAKNAYLLGFIAGDGYIHPNRNLIKIGLSATDKDFLLEVKEELQIERKLTEYQTNKGFDVVELSFSSSQIKEDLSKYSIVNNKTNKGITMFNIPDQFKWHFIRGLFDADGSYDYSNGHRIRISSLRREILDEIVSFTGLGYSYKETTRNIHTYTVTGKKSLEFINLMYEKADWFLKRKRNKIIQNIQPHETGALHIGDEKVC